MQPIPSTHSVTNVGVNKTAEISFRKSGFIIWLMIRIEFVFIHLFIDYKTVEFSFRYIPTGGIE